MGADAPYCRPGPPGLCLGASAFCIVGRRADGERTPTRALRVRRRRRTHQALRRPCPTSAASHADPEWCDAYAGEIGRPVTPVGEYSHMLLLIDDSGSFWGAFDADYGLMGDSIDDVVHALIVDPGTRRLHRVVPD